MPETRRKNINSTYAHYDILDGVASIYKRDDTKYWQFRMWINNDRKYLKKSLRTTDFNIAMSIARERAMELITNIRTGKQIYSITTQELVDLYLDYRKKDIDDKTGITKERITAIKSQLRHFLNIKGADTKLSELDSECLYDYSSLRRQSHNAQFVTIRNEQSTITAMWQFAYRKGHTNFESFEFKKFKIKNDEIGKRDTFKDIEYDKLIRFMRNWTSVKQCPNYKERLERLMVRDFVLISTNTCLRVGEARQLTWSDIEGYESHYDEKEKETRLVCLNIRWITSKVRSSRKFLTRGGTLFERLRHRQKFTEPHHLIFSMNGSKTLSDAKWVKHWKNLMNGIGIHNHKERKITWYSLRHFGISCRVKAGVSLIDLSKLAGTSVHHIEKTYLKYTEEMSRTSALKNFRKNSDGTITTIESGQKKREKERNSNEYGRQEIRLSSRHLH